MTVILLELVRLGYVHAEKSLAYNKLLVLTNSLSTIFLLVWIFDSENTSVRRSAL